MKDREYFVFSKELRNKNTTVTRKPLIFNEIPFSGVRSRKVNDKNVENKLVRSQYSKGHLFGSTFILRHDNSRMLDCTYFDFLMGGRIGLSKDYYNYDYYDCDVEIEYDRGPKKFNMELSSDDLDLERILNLSLIHI